jgi:hypothetical protein
MPPKSIDEAAGDAGLNMLRARHAALETIDLAMLHAASGGQFGDETDTEYLGALTVRVGADEKFADRNQRRLYNVVTALRAAGSDQEFATAQLEAEERRAKLNAAIAERDRIVAELDAKVGDQQRSHDRLKARVHEMTLSREKLRDSLLPENVLRLIGQERAHFRRHGPGARLIYIEGRLRGIEALLTQYSEQVDEKVVEYCGGLGLGLNPTPEELALKARRRQSGETHQSISGNVVDPAAWRRYRESLRAERDALQQEQAELEPAQQAFEEQLGRLRDRYTAQLSRVNAADQAKVAPPATRGGKGRAA